MMDTAEHPSDDSSSESVEAEDDPGWPWSFILLVVAGGVYLVLRFAALLGKALM